MEALGQASLVSLFALLVSAMPIVPGIAYALHRDERWLALMRPLTLAGVFAAVSSVFVGLANVFSALTSGDPGDSARLRLAALGLAELSVLAFGAFACLTVAWLCVAIGMRQPR